MEELTYPLQSPPPPGEILEIAPGVHWIRMQLPFALDHINLWALEDGDGWTIVDTGMQTPDIAAAWRTLIAGPLGDRPVKRVICTHMHPDHIGMAGWLTRKFDCRLWMTRLEYVTCRMLVADSTREAPPDAIRFYRASGWDEDALEDYKARFGRFGKMVYQLPDSYRRVADGEELLIGGRVWRAVVGHGHSPEHLSLYCAQEQLAHRSSNRAVSEATPSEGEGISSGGEQMPSGADGISSGGGLLISGDQVLPRITSNVSVFPTEPDADPLTDWLQSLASIKERVPDDVLVLPSHNLPFKGLWARLEQLIRGHEVALTRLTEALVEPKRAVDVFSLLFRRRVGSEMLAMASGESVAHLNCLIHRGRIMREDDAAGISWYRTT
jgi:glyoxylase-like metal-dependent hydrolase (beta-lactamase superfamily II)